MAKKSLGQLAEALWNFSIYELDIESKRRLRRTVRLLMIPVVVIFSALLLLTTSFPMFPQPDAAGQVATGFVIFSGPLSGMTPSVSYGPENSIYWLIIIVNTYLLGLGGEVVLSAVDVWVYGVTNHDEYPWEDVVVYKIGALFIAVTPLLFFYSDITGLLTRVMIFLFEYMRHVGQSVGLGLRLPFVLLVGLSLLLDDLLFYVGHRLSHNVRFMWKLGHVNHHRTQRLTRLTAAPDFPFFFLNGSRGSFVTQVIGRSFFTVLLGDVTPNQAVGGAALATLIRFMSASTAHSLACYVLFAKCRWLAVLEEVFVVGRVHYVHHSSLPEHNLANGCNFAATFSVWDKLFGTFARAPHEVPPTGLFHDEDLPGNPWKFAYAEWVKLLLELKRNRAQHWGMILFGPADYAPPTSGIGTLLGTDHAAVGHHHVGTDSLAHDLPQATALAEIER